MWMDRFSRPQGSQVLNNSWEGETNTQRATGRAMLGVYQAVFDAYDNEMVSQNTALVNGVMFRSTENFPGTVPNPTIFSPIYSVQIDGTLNEEFGSPGGYDSNAARRMTGAYLAPVAIARSLVMGTQVLLFDEPLSNLDAREVGIQSITILLRCHDSRLREHAYASVNMAPVNSDRQWGFQHRRGSPFGPTGSTTADSPAVNSS